MSLYKDASLVMIPSAVKDGKLYSIRPTDGSGDFTFSRGSNLAATRVDVNGLIEKGRENVLLQSNSFSSSSWIQTDITSTSGQVGYDSTNDAWELNATAANGNLVQALSFSGVNTLSFYAKQGSLQYVFILFNGGGFNGTASIDLADGAIYNTSAFIVDIKTTNVGGGWYRIEAVSNRTNSDIRIYPSNNNSGGTTAVGNIYIQDAQLEQGLVATDYIETGASTAQAGILEDLPRLDYSGGASCPSLLLEPSRTNSVTQSEYFGSSYWTKAGDVTLTSNYGTSPEGLTNADRIVANASSGGHIVYRNINTTGTHTISIFAKASGYNHLFLGYDGGSLNFGIVFNLSNGTISQNPASLTGSIEAVGSNGWYRCNLTFNYATTNYYFVAAPHDNSGNYNWTGNGTDGILIYGAQIELNSSYPTSYIPTYGSAVTRSGDALSITDIQTNNLIGSNQGSFVFHYKPYNAYTGSAGEIYDFRIDANNRMATYFSNGTLRLFSNIAGATNFNQGTTLDGDTEFKIGVGFDADSTLVYINGVLTYTLNGFDLALTDFDISPPTNGSKVSSFSWFSTKLTASELAALTTL